MRLPESSRLRTVQGRRWRLPTWTPGTTAGTVPPGQPSSPRIRAQGPPLASLRPLLRKQGAHWACSSAIRCWRGAGRRRWCSQHHSGLFGDLRSSLASFSRSDPGINCEHLHKLQSPAACVLCPQHGQRDSKHMASASAGASVHRATAVSHRLPPGACSRPEHARPLADTLPFPAPPMALCVAHNGRRQQVELLEFELAEETCPALLSERRRRPAARARRAASAAPFASVSMATASDSSVAPHKVPAFVVASAVESKPLALEGVPQWRITVGNLAAGATAGCAVEAGARRVATPCRCWARPNCVCLHPRALCRQPCQPAPSTQYAAPRLHPIRWRAPLLPTCCRRLPSPCRRAPARSAVPHRHHQDAAAGDALRRRHPRAAAGGRRAQPVRRRVGQPGRRGPRQRHIHGRVRAGQAGGSAAWARAAGTQTPAAAPKCSLCLL